MSNRLTLPVGPRDHVQGPATAPLTLVEYGDYECPHCGSAYPIVKEVQRALGDKLRFVFRNFPLANVHPHAERAAETAEWAAGHDRFWPMHDFLFEHQRTLDAAHLLAEARKLGLDPADLERAWAERSHAARVIEDLESGIASGVGGTPTFYVNGVKHQGPWGVDDLISALAVAK